MLAAAAAALLFASTGVAGRHLSEVTSVEMVIAWAAAWLGFFLLYRYQAFTRPERVVTLVLTLALLNTAAQATGGVASPVGLSLFLFLSLAAWSGRVKLELGGAALYGFLEAISTLSSQGSLEPHLYLRWATFLLFAFLLGQAVRVRAERDRLENRLKNIEHEAGQLSRAEPSTIDLPKDRLIASEERRSARVGAVVELEENLRVLLELHQRSLGLHTAACFLMSPLEGKMVLRMRAHATRSSALATDSVLVPGETLVGLAAKEGRRICPSPLAPESARALPYYHKPQAVRSFLAEPLRLVNPADPEEPELVGVLVFDSLEEGFFTPERLSWTELFVRALAEAVQSVRVLHFSETKTRNLQSLYAASKRYSAVIAPDEVVRTALQTAKEMLPCDSAYVALVGADGRTFDVKAWWGTKTELSKNPNQAPRLEEELAAWIRQNRRSIRYSRGSGDRSANLPVRREGLGAEVRSFLMVPLTSGENVLGVLRLNSRQPDAFQAWDEEVLSTLANQAATALEKAFLVAQMEEMAVRDGLTGAFNHRYFQERLEEELAKAERYNKDVALILMDVDHFKKFNDQYGHPEGDRVLKTVSRLVVETVRHRVDTVARYGGEEFVVILPESDANAAQETAERIRRRIESQIFEDGKGGVYRVTVSLGLACYPFDARTAAQLIHCADTALYASKAGGRNRVTSFSTLPPGPPPFSTKG